MTNGTLPSLNSVETVAPSDSGGTAPLAVNSRTNAQEAISSGVSIVG